jgi:hypothetical protein
MEAWRFCLPRRSAFRSRNAARRELPGENQVPPLLHPRHVSLFEGSTTLDMSEIRCNFFPLHQVGTSRLIQAKIPPVGNDATGQTVAVHAETARNPWTPAGNNGSTEDNSVGLSVRHGCNAAACTPQSRNVQYIVRHHDLQIRLLFFFP